MSNETLVNTSSNNFGQKRDKLPDTPNINLNNNGNKFVARSAFQIKFYKALSICRDFDEFTGRIEKILQDIGFEEYALSRLAVGGKITSPIQTMPEEMTSLYIQQGLYEHDLITKYAMNDNGPIFHSEIENHINEACYVTDEIRHNREIFKLFKSFSYNDFYFIPLGAHNGKWRILLSVATKDDNIADFKRHVENCKGALFLLAEAIEYIGVRKSFKIFLDEGRSHGIKITPKQLILLNTLAREDLNLPKIADKLCISIHTANKHIAAARQALEVSTIMVPSTRRLE